jgi:ATP-dependent DNA helicase DinG
VTRLAPSVQERLASEIEDAGGREVCFVGTVDSDGIVTDVRPVARGTASAVLALPGVAERGDMVLHNHPTGHLEPSPADLEVAVRLHDAGIGFGIVDNAGREVYVVVEVPRAKVLETLDAVGTADALGPHGPIATALGKYEDRPSQRDMAAFIADAYNDGGVALLEAGTGIGKSFAYLAPAIEWATRNGERTIVSTNTINLQEQLVGKDLPFLRRAFEALQRPPTFALLKGWNNYLCLNRLQLARQGQGSLLEPEWQPELETLVEWAERTTDGSLSDLPDPPPSEVWDEVKAEADLCHRLECPHFDRCFLFAARRRAAEADIVVVNHHLLASDLAIRRVQENWQDAAVLPPYRRLILDEGHHLEDVAARHLGSQVTARGVVRLLGRLERNGKGLVPTMIAELRRAGDALAADTAEILARQVLRAVGDARGYADRVFGILWDFLESAGHPVVRLNDDFARDAVWEQGLGVALDNLVGTLNKMRDDLDLVADRLAFEDDPDRRSDLLRELRGVVRRLQSASDGFALTLRPAPGALMVRWVERRGERTGKGVRPIGLAAVPLDLAGVLRDALFDRVETVILTSATLAAGGDFQFLRGRIGLGLPPELVRFEEVLPSPFDYPDRCLFAVPTDVPDPRTDAGGHDRAVADAIVHLAHAGDGGLFALFTSHAQLRRVAGLIRQAVGHRWPLLVQGEGQRDTLLRRFRESGSAILLGTDSFWEGVDVPGRALRTLILAKVPFRVPTEPLTAARLELLESQGGDGFRDYLLPLAALKLKQGFGRLIRTATDLGVVLLMDSRVVTRPYGSMLVASLPPARRVVGTWPDVGREVEEFFAHHGIGAPI